LTQDASVSIHSLSQHQLGFEEEELMEKAREIAANQKKCDGVQTQLVEN